jgi:hypothetical protein
VKIRVQFLDLFIQEQLCCIAPEYYNPLQIFTGVSPIAYRFLSCFVLYCGQLAEKLMREKTEFETKMEVSYVQNVLSPM